MYKNFNIRKIPYGTIPTILHDRIELKVGLGTSSSSLTMEEGYDLNLYSNTGIISLASANTANSFINLNANTLNVSN